MSRVPALFVFVVACSSSRLALAAEPSHPSPAPSDQRGPVSTETAETEWYGWQTLGVDALSIGTIFASQGEAATLGFVGYLGGAPLVHAVHGNVAKGVGSFGLRVGLPVAGGGIGLVFARCNGLPGYCRLEAFGIGFLSGMGVAMAVDSAALAYERRPVKPVARVVPNIFLARGGGGATLSGAF